MTFEPSPCGCVGVRLNKNDNNCTAIGGGNCWLNTMHAAKGTPERDAYDKKLAMMKEVMGAKAFFLPSLGRTDLSIKFHNRMTVAGAGRVCLDFFCTPYAPNH